MLAKKLEFWNLAICRLKYQWISLFEIRKYLVSYKGKKAKRTTHVFKFVDKVIIFLHFHTFFLLELPVQLIHIQSIMNFCPAGLMDMINPADSSTAGIPVCCMVNGLDAQVYCLFIAHVPLEVWFDYPNCEGPTWSGLEEVAFEAVSIVVNVVETLASFIWSRYHNSHTQPITSILQTQIIQDLTRSCHTYPLPIF